MKVFLCIFMVCICVNAHAKMYVTADKTTGDPLGVVHVRDEHKKSWEERYDLIDADESFAGKEAWEMKKDGDTIRHATKQEKDAHKAADLEAHEARIIDKFLEKLNDVRVKDKIKDINKP